MDAPLSEGQKVCLRLVARGMSSKEIAQQIGLSHQTVDTYVKGALPKLGASNRREAARLFAALEHSQKLEPQPPALGGHSAPVVDQKPIERTAGPKGLGIPPIGGRLHELDAAGKTVTALRVGLTGAAVFTAVTLFMTGLLYLVR